MVHTKLALRLATTTASVALFSATASPQVTVHEPGLTISVFSSGGLLAQPLGLRFGPDGALYVANSISYISASNTGPGNVVRIDPAEVQSSYASGAAFAGPIDVDFNPGTTFGAAGELFATVEDSPAQGLGYSYDPVLRVPPGGGAPTIFTAGGPVTTFYENWGVRFGRGNGFGGDVYVSARADATGPYDLFRVDPGGGCSFFTLKEGTTDVLGVLGFEFGPGGAFGTDLYVGTWADPLAPGAVSAIFRADATGAAVQFAALTGSPVFLTFGPGPGTTLGEYLYVSAGGAVHRIDPAGNISKFASTTSGAFHGLAVAPTGDLYVSDPYTSTVYVITAASSAYCTAGVSASGCQAALDTSGAASASAASGFDLSASSVEGAKDGLFFFGTNGRQANPWGNGTSYQCVAPPVKRGGLLTGRGTPGVCDGWFVQDLNALWCPSCAKPGHNPGPGTLMQAQLWYRDPQNTSNQTTSLSNAIEFPVGP